MADTAGLEPVWRLVFEAAAYAVARIVFLREWRVAGGGRVELPASWRLEPGGRLSLEREVEVPRGGGRWLLVVDTNAYGVVYLDGGPWWGIDGGHPYAIMPPGSHRVSLRLSPLGYFGVYEEPVVVRGVYLVEVDWGLYSLAVQLQGLVEYLASLGGPLASRLLDLVEGELRDAVRGAPSIAQVAVASLLMGSVGRGVFPLHGRVDVRPPPPLHEFLALRYGGLVLRGEVSDYKQPTVPAGLKARLERLIDTIASMLPRGEGRVYAAGHSHLDTAWLWTLRETREKLLGTFATAAGLLEMYPEASFVQSTSFYYEELGRLSPELLARVSRLVGEGRWVPVGGMYVESDTNLVSGESLARQLLYGQHTLERVFGRRARIGWLPDSFGYSSGLPQLLRQAGIEVLIVHKLEWNDTNRFPYRMFRWRGGDGSEVVVELLPSYTGPATPSSIASRGRGQLLYLYGYGDGGGGPTPEMLEHLRLAARIPSLPEVRHFREEEYLREVGRVKGRLPVWSGELYVEKHRGTYTTNLKVKRLIARAEAALVRAETVASLAWLLGRGDWQDRLDTLWKKLLLQMFHDILPGSSIREVYDEAYSELRGVIGEAEAIALEALKSIVGEGDGVAVFNTLPWRRRVLVGLDVEGLEYRGVEVECQDVGDGRLFLLELPPLGYRVYSRSKSCATPRDGVRVRWNSGRAVLENGLVRVEIGRDGLLYSVRVRGLGEVLLKPSNILKVYPDKPGVWDAWDTVRAPPDAGELFEVEEEPHVVVEGPLLSCIGYRLSYGSSRVEQRVCLEKGGSIVSFRTLFDWRDKGVLVKAWFHPAVDSEEYYADAPYSVTVRKVHPTGDRWEAAKFEAPAVHWVDYSDAVRGLAVIAPDRHGYSVWRGAIGLSLLRSPLAPNPWSDLGLMETEYHLYPHRGGYSAAAVPRAALNLLHEPLVAPGGRPGFERSLLALEGPAVLGAVKRSVDGRGLVLRLYNYDNRAPARVRVSVHTDGLCRVSHSNILEDRLTTARLGEGIVGVELRPLEVKTIILEAC